MKYDFKEDTLQDVFDKIDYLMNAEQYELAFTLLDGQELFYQYVEHKSNILTDKIDQIDLKVSHRGDNLIDVIDEASGIYCQFLIYDEDLKDKQYTVWVESNISNERYVIDIFNTNIIKRMLLNEMFRPFYEWELIVEKLKELDNRYIIKE